MSTTIELDDHLTRDHEPSASILEILAFPPVPIVVSDTVKIEKMAGGPEATLNDTPRNVIIFVASGLGPAHLTLARAVSDETLWLDTMHTGSVTTYSIDRWITDAPSAATAISCGKKTVSNMLGVDADGKACGTIVEAAQRTGRKIGVVATAPITAPIPASFLSHSTDRNAYSFIGEQILEKELDVAFTGGQKYFHANNGTLLNSAIAKKFTVVQDVASFRNMTKLSPPLIGLFADENIPYEINRDHNTYPSLAEMTAKALELLSEEEESSGFVLLVFGSRIDHAARASDAAALAREVLAFDDAVYEGIKFHAHVDQSTLILGVSPFEAGGLVLGINSATDQIDIAPEELAKIKASLDTIASALVAETQNGTLEDIRVVLEAYGVNATEAELEGFAGITSNFAACRAHLLKVITQKTFIGFTTPTRTGVDTGVWARGDDADKVKGRMENDEFGRLIATLMAADLAQATDAVKDFDPRPTA